MAEVQVQPNESEGAVSRKTLKPKETLRRAKEHLQKDEYVEAITLLERIDSYVIEAAFLLGVIFFDGLGVDVDMERGIRYMEKISVISDMIPEEEFFVRQAQLNLGDLCYRGIEVPKSDEDAVRYWLMAASGKKDPSTGKPYPPTVKAQTALGKFFFLESTRDIERSLYWHQKAASNGSFESEASLGMMAMYGFGIPVDPIKAYLCLTSAALKGSIYAYGILTAFYYSHKMYYNVVEIGSWVSKIEDVEEYAEHIKCTPEDVRITIAMACFYLALCYQYGLGVKKSLSTAKELITRTLQMKVKLGMSLHIRAIMDDS